MGARSTGSHPTTTKADGHLLEYFRSDMSAGGGGNSGPTIPPSGLTATGGVINDYTDGGNSYRAHIFTGSGTFNVTALSTPDSGLPNSVEYLVVAGGGGGGNANGGGGGGGAGGLRTNLSGHPLAGAAFPVAVSPYTVTVGAGGLGANPSPRSYGLRGENSVFGTIISTGGGGGRTGSVQPDGDGGSGGGGSYAVSGGAGNTPATSPSQGNSGGDGYGSGSGSPAYGGGGGGGAGAVGADGTSSTGGAAGIGSQVLIAGPPASTQPVGTPGPNPGGGYFAGGGGGGAYEGGPTGSGGSGGGGQGGTQNSGYVNGTANTGGGGGGCGGEPHVTPIAAAGGSGIVVVRYRIL